MRFADTTLAIIAGGRATRLGGVPKGLLVVEGEPVIARQLRLGQAFAEVLLVANDPLPYAPFGVRAVPDLVPGKGAPGGVHAALHHARRARVLAVAGDMPFVTEAAAAALLEEGRGAPLACFEVAGRLEPLLGVYDAALAPAFGVLLGEDPSFRRLFSALGGRTLAEQALRRVDPALRAVVSLNAPEDLRRWGARLPDVGPGGQAS